MTVCRLASGEGVVLAQDDVRQEMGWLEGQRHVAEDWILGGRVRWLATPLLKAGLYFFRDLYDSDRSVYRVTVLDTAGNTPSVPPSRPQWAHYYAVSQQGVPCLCAFGSPPDLSCNA